MSEIINISVAVPANKLGALYAAVAGLFGSAAVAPLAASQSGNSASAATAEAGPVTPSTTSAPDAGISATASTSTTAPPSASPSDGAQGVEVDAAGVPWNPDMHASTKGKTKDGLWRMKVGVPRPEDHKLPAESAASAPAAASSPSPAPQTVTSAPPAEDDEFAAFRAAAAAPVARQWADADLSKLCNQAAMAKGDPEPVKAIVAKYVPADEIAHSRNIPAESREAFAQEIEQTFGIQYAG